MCRHHEIRPVERDCICLERRSDGSHIAACNAALREKLFGAWRGVRAAFQADAAERQLLDGIGNAAALN